MTTRLSSWCWTPPGAVHTPAQHATCQDRQDAGLLGGCGCPEHGGHTRAEGPAEDGEDA